MSVSEYVSEPRTYYSNGSSHTTHVQVRRTEFKKCTKCDGSGQIMCYICGGRGYVGCNTCDLNGHITCRTCAGHGRLTCKPCDGSGKTGSSSQAVIENTYQVSVLVPNRDVDPTALPIVKKVGASVATGILLKKIEDTKELDAKTSEIVVGYSAYLRIVHMDVKCNDKQHHVIAYGQSLDWHDTGQLIETLIEDDLISLEKMIVENLSKGFFTSDIDSLLAALQSVAASEINIISTEAPDRSDNGSVISSNTKNRIRSAVTSSVYLIYKRLAARYW